MTDNPDRATSPTDPAQGNTRGEKVARPPKPADPKRLLRLDEVADRLNVSITTVRRLVAADELPVVRVGKAVRVRPADVEDYIRRVTE